MAPTVSVQLHRLALASVHPIPSQEVTPKGLRLLGSDRLITRDDTLADYWNGRSHHIRKQATFDAYTSFLGLMAPFEVFVPKFHVMLHMLANQRFQGNPLVYSNWEDETLNKTLKAACKFVSQSTFEVSVLLRMQTILGRSPKRALDVGV